MASDRLIQGYAEALFSVVRAEGELDRVEDELFRIARTVEADAELREQLTNPAAPVPQKLAIVDELLRGRAHPQTIAAVMYVVQAGHARQLTDIADAFAHAAAESRSRALAEVRTAVELTERQRQELARALSQATGRDIELKVVVDPDVVGGVVAKVGDTVIDGSVSRRLADLRARLTGA